MTFSNAFLWMKSVVLRFEFHWSLFIRVQKGSIGLGNGLAPNRRQALTRTNADLIHWHLYAAPKKPPTVHIIGHLWEFTDGFPSQMASNAEIVPCHDITKAFRNRDSHRHSGFQDSYQGHSYHYTKRPYRHRRSTHLQHNNNHAGERRNSDHKSNGCQDSSPEHSYWYTRSPYWHCRKKPRRQNISLVVAEGYDQLDHMSNDFQGSNPRHNSRYTKRPCRCHHTKLRWQNILHRNCRHCRCHYCRHCRPNRHCCRRYCRHYCPNRRHLSLWWQRWDLWW